MSDSTCENPQIQSPLNRASKDKFYLILNLPYILRNSSDPLLKKPDPLQISVFGTIVPPINVPAVEVRFGGQSTNVSSHSRPNYGPLSLSFVVGNDYTNYFILWKWLAAMNDPKTSLYNDTPLKQQTTNYYAERGNLHEYQTTMSIVALNEYNEDVIKFTYTKCFITNLGGITYNYRDGEILETTAEFQFDQLFVETSNKF